MDKNTYGASMTKIISSILLLFLSLNIYSQIGSSCKSDIYVKEQIGEYYFHERMNIKNQDGEVIGAMLVNFSSMGSIEGIFLCGSARELDGQYFFGMSTIVSYDDLLSNGSSLKNIRPYINQYKDSGTIDFYNAKTVSETDEMVIIEVTMRVRSIASGRYISGEKVFIEVRKEDYLYE